MKIYILIFIAVTVFLFFAYKFLPHFYALRGSFLFEKAGIDTAVKMYEKAYKTKRASVATKLTYGLLLLRTALPEQAEEIFNEVIFSINVAEKKKNSAKQFRCMAYIKLNKIDDALEDALELLNKYKNSELYAIAGFAMILSKKSAREIMEFCVEAYDYNQDNRDIVDNYSVACILTGKYEKAVELCDMIIEKNQYFPEGHYHKALALFELGSMEKAIEEVNFLDECDFKYLTTITDDEIDDLRKRIEKCLNLS